MRTSPTATLKRSAGKPSSAARFEPGRTSALTCSPRARSIRTSCDPTKPVAPVTREKDCMRAVVHPKRGCVSLLEAGLLRDFWAELPCHKPYPCDATRHRPLVGLAAAPPWPVAARGESLDRPGEDR